MICTVHLYIPETMARSNERMLSELVQSTAEEVTHRKDAAEQVFSLLRVLVIIWRTAFYMSQTFLFLQESTKILDKYTLWEMGDNEWLKSEVSEGRAELSTFLPVVCTADGLNAQVQTHTERVQALRDEVTRLEQVNLTVLANLFQCTIEDLRLSKCALLTVQCSVFINRHQPAVPIS